MYLTNYLLMMYDVNLFQFVLNLMEVMCLTHEIMGMHGLGDWNLLSKNVRSNCERK